MATVPDEQRVQRTHHYQVGISHNSNSEDSPAELLWAGTTLGNTVTTDKAVAANQADQADTEARLQTAYNAL